MLGLHQKGAVVSKLALLLVAVLLVFSSGLVACTQPTEEEEGLPTFVAHFMTPEREPYPFDVTISNGTWRKEFTDVISIDTEVPCDATYTLSYRWGGWESYRNFDMSFAPGEVREFEFYAYDASDVEFRTRPYLLSQEVGCNASLSWTWNAEATSLNWTVSGQTGKYVSLSVWFSPADPSWVDGGWYISEAVDPNKIPTGWCEGGQDHSTTSQPAGVGVLVPQCYTKWQHYASTKIASEITGYYHFVRIDPNLVAPIRIGYGLYKDNIVVYPIDTTLASLDGTPAELIREFFDPQYAVPEGNYVLTAGNMPQGYASLAYPISVEAGKGTSINKFYLPKTSELSDFTFLVAAESAFSHSAYSGLTHDEVNKTLGVNITTETDYDWWGCFVLPKGATVTGIFAESRDLPIGWDLRQGEDYTINLVGNYNICCVRIQPEIDRLNLHYEAAPAV
jgi:hypothetical protein